MSEVVDLVMLLFVFGVCLFEFFFFFFFTSNLVVGGLANLTLRLRQTSISSKG